MTVISKFHRTKVIVIWVLRFEFADRILKSLFLKLQTILKDNVFQFVLFFIILPSNAEFYFLVDISRFYAIAGFLCFQALRVFTNSAGPRAKLIIHVFYWTISGLAITMLIILPYLHFTHQNRVVRNTFFAIIVGLFFSKVIASIFFLVDDLRRAIQWAAGKLFFSNTEGETMEQGVKISRSVFLSWAGMIVGGGLFSSLVYGISNKYRYRVIVCSSFDNFPAGFKGLKIVQISDIHSGSFTDKEAVMRGVQKVINEKADLILFTGDLVNNVADEMDDYMDVFDKIKAPMGVYSTLGIMITVIIFIGR